MAKRQRHDSSLLPGLAARSLIERILDTPHLGQVVPQLQPGLLHQVIQTCGLEECGELVALATPHQLEGVFDLDLWRAASPGLDEKFDADRFGVWLEVLVDVDPDVAARTVASLDLGLVTTGLAQHARVAHLAAIPHAPSPDDDDHTAEEFESAGKPTFTHDLGGYRFFSTRTDSWDAIVAMLTALNGEHQGYFQRLLRGWIELSNDGYESDGLDDLLSAKEQTVFDVAASREGRRERQGYATPDQARAFLQMSRQLQRGPGTSPPVSTVTLAYFRAMGHDTTEPDLETHPTAASQNTALMPNPSLDAFVQVISEAGILPQATRALLDRPEGQLSRLAQMQAHMRFVRNRHYVAYSMRSQELAYLVNTLVAGGSIQGRPFSLQEASDASVAVCNLGLENWPPHWPPSETRSGTARSQTRTSLPEDFLVGRDLVTVFQVGWAILYEQVCLYAAQQLVRVLRNLRCDDRETQKGLNALRIEMAQHWKAGTPWLARDALDVITILDMPAWAALLGLIDQCPVMHAALGASNGSGLKTVGASAFAFISENSQIAAAHQFMEALPDTLSAA
ncbi:MAG: DUF6178 family protein [Vicinamibacterales bacterium]